MQSPSPSAKAVETASARRRASIGLGARRSALGGDREAVDDDQQFLRGGEVIARRRVRRDACVTPSATTRMKPWARRASISCACVTASLRVAGRSRSRSGCRAGATSRRSVTDGDAVGLQLAVADRAVRVADAGPEQAQEVVDLGGGADGGARRPRRILLLDRDGGREAVDEVDVGLLHPLEELARVGGERLDVAALSLGVDRVEGEGALAGAGGAGDDRDRAAGDLEVDPLEIVLARAADRHVRLHGGGR